MKEWPEIKMKSTLFAEVALVVIYHNNRNLSKPKHTLQNVNELIKSKIKRQVNMLPLYHREWEKRQIKIIQDFKRINTLVNQRNNRKNQNVSFDLIKLIHYTCQEKRANWFNFILVLHTFIIKWFILCAILHSEVHWWGNRPARVKVSHTSPIPLLCKVVLYLKI